MYEVEDVSAAWTCAAGGTSVAKIAAPAKSGFGYVGPIYAYSGVGGVDVVATHTGEITVRNHLSASKSGTAKARLLYIRSK